MPCSALKLEFSFFFLDAGAVSGHSAINWSVKVEECDYSIQINEDNIPLLSLTGSVAGSVYSFQVYDTKYENKCMVNNSIKEKSKMELVRHSFKNSSGEVCFLDNLTLKTDSDGGVFSYYVWFSGVSFRVSCEPSASIPDKCGKSKAFAETVLLSDNAFKCDSLGGKFDGGVYPQKAPDGTDEYCVSGTCSNLCDSAWHRNVVKEIKDSVCCGRMKLEPQTGNGKCTEPKAMDSTKIGVNFPEVKLGCSGTPAGGGLNYCEVPSISSSSSFEEALSSSSYEDSESSSSGEGEGESDSEVDCFADVGMAASNLHSKIRRCEQEGGVSDFSEYSGCVYGSCLPPSSSSSGEQSSSSEEQSNSSSGDGESGVCSDGTQFSQKSEADLYDDWVYIGKETYGYRKARMRISDLRGMYFDALGRMSEKMQGSRFYFLKNSPIIEEWDEPLQFKVYAKTIADSELGEIQAFIKEDEENGLRRDSVFYINDNYFEILETNEKARTIKSLTSLGIKTSAEYDDKWRLNKMSLIDGNGDTISTKKYIWENGKLVKTIFNGVERAFIYGKTLHDTVKVVPSDEGLFFHSGYNNTAGKIPSENDPMYKYFAMNPYGLFEIQQKNFVTLQKESPYKTLKTILKDINPPIYYNPPFSKNLDKSKIYPKDSAMGETAFGFRLGSVCINNECGKFYISYESKITNEKITLYQSFLVYEKPKWKRYCRTQDKIQLTYYHEAQHVYNARNMARWLARSYMTSKTFSKWDECEIARNQGREDVIKYFEFWSDREKNHESAISPKPTNFELEVMCDEYTD